ncbi:thermostable hemolysin [Litoribrevibacter albus]|uniref:Thermostable hemolysin n=1 Tax=Litoribrevibacter albus TaxID=1473156 RepID=A0AA37SA82_9GAMM|nr:thermostable hemolysin [Litoribrevibacter albus]GLQ31145.1 hypothetical protein GCM10007876_16240 [Litoribrevibacter albus]
MNKSTLPSYERDPLSPLAPEPRLHSVKSSPFQIQKKDEHSSASSLNSKPAAFEVVEAAANGRIRQASESFIQQVFGEKYNAEVNVFLMHLVALFKSGSIACVVGYQAADEVSKLYLEQYLDAPIEQVIAQVTGQTPGRNQIVEVGNLASTNPGSFRQLFFLLSKLFYQQEHQWIAFTASSFLLETFDAFGVEWTEIAKADPSKLVDHSSDWGSYYQSSPSVIVANVGKGISRLMANPVFRRMFDQAPEIVVEGERS